MTASSIRSEVIDPPAPPDEHMLGGLVAAFKREPRIVEAWLRGERLTPDDGSPGWETTEVVLVLDPPLPKAPKEIAAEIASIEQTLAPTGWATGRKRSWIYAPHDGRSDRHGSRIYRRGDDR